VNTLSPSWLGLSGEESFCLPISGLFADLETGSAAVRMTDEFEALSPLFRVRLIQRWLMDFKTLKDAAAVELFRQFCSQQPDVSIVEQIDSFRRACDESQITCPGDLAILLQRF
jgi:hypothetical protein